jgi:pre-mRNA-splicing helicase BRR2
VKNFSNRLKDFGVTVRELSGDSSLSRQQIAETQLIVTTPEKFDIILRQGEGRAFTQLVKLVIIDEIHLLHDERGPVLESIVARIIRQVETTAEPIRLVGLSATLPNYRDVATFLRVKPDKGLFFFDHSYRPVPLQMQYIGITERNAFKRFQVQNEVCYEKAMDQRKSGYQILIFVHSRAETAKTAKALRDIAAEREETSYFVRDGSATQEILREEASSSAKNADLKDVLPFGFAIHHAGMPREDRELVEDLFADRHIGVLCTTATLAWGVNLPAHAVIIKGTQIYDPSKGKWAELSPLDVLQMLGRAGRPQYDSEGEGIILTQHSELQYYLSLTNMQLPVESQLIKTLPNHLNAEIALGSIQTIGEAVDWISYTFLYVRMMKNPESYGISEAAAKEDKLLEKRRLDLVHSAATILEKCQLIQYDRKSGAFHATPLGRVASHFYITHSSMAVYNRHMRPNMSDIELLRLFSLSGEFAHITVREEEKLELTKLAARVPIPVKESPSEPSAKVNILLQAYISRLKLDGFALVADMAFIRQSAARIMRALFEIALRRRWSSLAKLCLDMSNMVSYRVWRSQSPLRQFNNVPEVVARKLERKSDIEWDRYQDLTASDLGELVGVPRMGRVLHKLVHQFPRLEISAQVQPITRSMLRVELTLVPAFQFDVAIHGYVQEFHIIVEDVNGEMMLHHENFSLKSRNTNDEHVLLFTVPILEPLPPAYFIRVVSDRWLHSSSVLPLSFSSLILPAKFSAPTELLDLQPLLPAAVGEPALARVFSTKEFNPIQTQTFHELFKTDRNCLICAPPGSGKIVCAMFAVMRMLSTNADGKCVYVGPSDPVADAGFAALRSTFGPLLGKDSVLRLTGETAADLKSLVQGKIVVASAKQWDMLSRRWRQRKAVQAVSLLVFDELQFLGGEYGPTLEIVISRARYMAGQLSQADNSTPCRVVGLGASIANARDVGEWMGVSSKSLFNFSPKTRPYPVEIYFQSFDQSNYSSRLLAMAKPVFNALDRHIGQGTALVFVPSRRQAQLTAIDIMSYSASSGSESYRGNSTSEEELTKLASTLREPALQQVLPAGVAFVHGGMVQSDWDALIGLQRKKAIRVIVCPADLCWKLPCVGDLIVVMGTEAFDGAVGRHVDYPIVDLLRMMGSHPEGSSGKSVVLCHAPKKAYLKKLLDDPLPIESHLDSYLHDSLNAEIVTKTVGSMQDAIDYLTWTFLYRRLPKNPTYYGLRGTSNDHLSEHLSEMIETVVGDLEESRCCKISAEDGEVSPLNLGMIAAYYYVQYRTLELVASSVTAKTKIRGILEILSASWEFSTLPMRFGEDKTMKHLARTLTHALPEGSAFDANTKALVLLQSHFSRKTVSPDMRSDQHIVLKESVTLLQAIIDVISSNGWLKPALAAMELSQMTVQGLWNKDHVLKQIPHFSDEIVKRCVAYKGEEAIESVFDILTLEDDVRNDLLRLPDEKMADVAVFCNNYPNIEVSFDVEDADDVTAGDPVKISVSLEREVDEDMEEEELAELGKVSAPLFPGEKKEGWWLVVGDMSNNSLLSLKRVNLKQNTKVSLEFLAPEDAGDYDLTLFCMSDSYLGCDQEYKIPLSVAPAADSDDDSDDDDEESNGDK